MNPTGPVPTSVALLDRHDALLLDLDGVVHLGDQAAPYAVDVLGRVRDRGTPLAFVTNNASRTREDVAAALRRLGVAADPAEVMTSAVATAELLAGQLEPGAPVLVVGGEGLWAAVEQAGLTPVADAGREPVAVVQGWGPDVAWRDLAEATVALRAGARWVVTNRDPTLPSPRGPLPGSGALVAAITVATGQEPETVVGKPRPELFRTAAGRLGAAAALVVGDRPDTDIAGARAGGLASLLVLTGVAGPDDVLALAPERRPDYLGRDLRDLELAQPAVETTADEASCRGWVVTAAGAVRGRPADPADALDGLRAAAALAWSGLLPPDRYDDVLAALDLD